MNHPVSIDLDAPVVVQRSLTIHAPLDRVWQLHTDITRWPQWNPDITRAQTQGDLQPGSTFHWHTQGLDIDSTIYDLVPYQRTLWGGPAHGIIGIHAWTFTDLGDSIEVLTEESWSGDPINAAVEQMRQALDDSLASWLNHLQAAAQQPTHP